MKLYKVIARETREELGRFDTLEKATAFRREHQNEFGFGTIVIIIVIVEEEDP